MQSSAVALHYRSMATIQIRDVPEDVYEVIRKRARDASQSIQGYMKTQIVRLASEPDEDELFAEVESFIDTQGIRLDMDALLADRDG